MPKSVTEAYPELIHYTTAGGLTGIINSGCFWASHAGFLNDAEEMTHFFDERLPALASETIGDFASSLKMDEVAVKRIAEAGGMESFVAGAVDVVIKAIRNSTLNFNQPFIFSMSAPTDERVAKNGLLSQWRGYGGDGGYAIVLDCQAFDKLLITDAGARHYQFVQWGDVYYYGLSGDLQPASEEVKDYEAIAKQGILAIARGEHPETVEKLYDSVTSLSCLFKHWGFAEEQEVRVIAIPPSRELASAAAEAGEHRPCAPIKSFLRAGAPVPYIELFGGLNLPIAGRLPIKRVIVGPHKDKFKRRNAVEHLLRSNGYEAEVVCSEIPYIGA
jgi:Protein of unknown function (DUF2971)